MQILTPIINVRKDQTGFRNIKEVEEILDEIEYNLKKSAVGAKRLRVIHENYLVLNIVLSVLEHKFRKHKHFAEIFDWALTLKKQSKQARDKILSKQAIPTNLQGLARDFIELVGNNVLYISDNKIKYFYVKYENIYDEDDYLYEEYWLCLRQDKEEYSLACFANYVPPSEFKSSVPVLDLEDVKSVLDKEGIVMEESPNA